MICDKMSRDPFLVDILCRILDYLSSLHCFNFHRHVLQIYDKLVHGCGIAVVKHLQRNNTFQFGIAFRECNERYLNLSVIFNCISRSTFTVKTQCASEMFASKWDVMQIDCEIRMKIEAVWWNIDDFIGSVASGASITWMLVKWNPSRDGHMHVRKPCP